MHGHSVVFVYSGEMLFVILKAGEVDEVAPLYQTKTPSTSSLYMILHYFLESLRRGKWFHNQKALNLYWMLTHTFSHLNHNQKKVLLG